MPHKSALAGPIYPGPIYLSLHSSYIVLSLHSFLCRQFRKPP